MPDDTTVPATPATNPTVWVEAGTTPTPCQSYYGFLDRYDPFNSGTFGGIVYYSGTAPEITSWYVNPWSEYRHSIKESDFEDVESGLP